MNIPTVKLSNGVEMPQVGYGVFLVPPVKAGAAFHDRFLILDGSGSHSKVAPRTVWQWP